MEDNLDLQMASSDLKVSEEIKGYLIVAGKWSRFLGIITYVMSGFIGIAAISMLVVASQASFRSSYFFGMSFVYILMGVLYVFMGLFLFRFGKNAVSAGQNSKQGDFSYAMQSLKTFFKFMGIVTIVVISLYILFIIVGIGAIAMLR